MAEVIDCPTKVSVDAPEGAEFKVYLHAEPKTREELETLVQALGGWGAVRLGSGILAKSLFADDVEGADNVNISLDRLIGPPPTPPIVTEIQRRIDHQLEAGE